MAERETITGPDAEPSAMEWAGKWLQSDLAVGAASPRPTPVGEPVTRSLGTGDASTGVRSTDLSVAPVRFGGYEILEKIGLGGMGAVYRVRHLKLGRIEAMKVIAPRSWDDSVARSRFEREFKSLAKIEHPNIVPVYDAGAWEGLPYFTMKHVPGGALSKHLDRFRADPAAAARLMAKVARAVHHLHKSDVLHRDLKPHNILIGDGDEPLVADFGLVKDLGEDSDASVTGTPMGTRQYMSPEQTRGLKDYYAPACDIWSVGVILYELLGGARPFVSDDAVLLYGKIREANPRPLTELNPAVPTPLAAITHRCLAKSPNDRYATAEGIAADLEAWLGGDAVTATLPPVPRPPRRRWTRWAGGAAVVVVSIAIGLIVLPGPGGQSPTTDSQAPINPPAVGERVGEQPAVLPQPPPAPIRSVADRLRAGEKVVLIGPNGPPPQPTRQLPGSTADLTTTADGECVLPGFEFSAVELLGDGLPLPVVVTAEIDLGGTRPTSWGGVYAGGVAWAGAAVQFNSVVAATIQRDDRRAVGDDWLYPTLRSADVVGWAGSSAAGRVTVGRFPQTSTQHAKSASDQHDWHRVSLTVAATGVDVAIGAEPARRVDWVRKVSEGGRINFAGTPALGAWVPPPQVPGPGIGLIVVQAQLFVRNVTVSSP